MSWLRRRRSVYAVDGVEPYRNGYGWDIYRGDALAERAAVVEALARLPRVPALEFLPFSLALGTRDGREWALTFGDEALMWFDLSHPGGSDIFEETLAGALFTDVVGRADHDVFAFTTTAALTADVVLAHCLDVCGEVFRRLGDLPPA